MQQRSAGIYQRVQAPLAHNVKTLSDIRAPSARMSETDTEESLPKWPGFDVPVPNVEPTAEGKEVGLSHLDSTGLELLLEISIEGKRHFVLVDSGASLSVLKPGISSSKLVPTQTAAKGITGKKLRIIGTQIITFCVGSKTFEHEFLIAPLEVDYSGVLGVDVLKRMEAKVDLRTSTLVLGRTSHRLSGQEVERLALINRHPQAGREASGTGLITPEATGPKASVGSPIPGLSSGGSDIRDWDVVASGPVVLPPLSEGTVVGKIRGRCSLAIPREVVVEPAGIGTPGAYVAQVASRVYTREEIDGLSDLGKR